MSAFSVAAAASARAAATMSAWCAIGTVPTVLMAAPTAVAGLPGIGAACDGADAGVSTAVGGP